MNFARGLFKAVDTTGRACIAQLLCHPCPHPHTSQNKTRHGLGTNVSNMECVEDLAPVEVM